MSAVLTALLRALGHLSDGPIVRVLVKSIGITIGLFLVLGFVLVQLTEWALERFELAWFNSAGAVLAALVAFIASWLLFRIVAVAVLQFFADEVVIAVERKSYPDAAQTARALPFREDLSNSLRGAGRALLANIVAAPFALVLLATAIGPAILFWAVNAVLLGRELHDMAWLRHRQGRDDFSGISPTQRFALGGAVAALMIIPFANLLAPVLGAAAATHLVQSTRKIPYVA